MFVVFMFIIYDECYVNKPQLLCYVVEKLHFFTDLNVMLLRKILF